MPHSLCSRSPGLRELKCWAKLWLELCGRGHEAHAALSAAFGHVYVRPQLGEEMRAAALQAYASSQGRVVATGDPWFQPAVWPLPLHAGAFADESELTTVTRDGSVVLFWAGRQVADDLGRQHPGLDLAKVPSAMACAGLATATMLPGYVLLAGLVGHPASTPSGDLVPLREAWLPSRLLAALRIYAERALLPAYGQWAAAMLHHCQATLQQLDWSAGAESTAAEMYQGVGCFLDTVFSQSPHAMQLEPDRWSGKRDFLYSMAASAAVVQGCEAAAKCKRAATTLQLSCCLFMWPMVSICCVFVRRVCWFAGHFFQTMVVPCRSGPAGMCPTVASTGCGPCCKVSKPASRVCSGLTSRATTSCSAR